MRKMRRRPGQLQASPAQFRSELLQIECCCWGVASPRSQGGCQLITGLLHARRASFIHLAIFSSSKFSCKTRPSGGNQDARWFRLQGLEGDPSLPFVSIGPSTAPIFSSLKALCLLHAILARFKRHRFRPTMRGQRALWDTERPSSQRTKQITRPADGLVQDLWRASCSMLRARPSCEDPIVHVLCVRSAVLIRYWLQRSLMKTLFLELGGCCCGLLGG